MSLLNNLRKWGRRTKDQGPRSVIRRWSFVLRPQSGGHGLLDIDALERDLGLSFVSKSLLWVALTHSSYLNENPGIFAESNERLEFLGDAVIGLAVGHELFDRYPDVSEGALTIMRSAIVSRETLSRIAQSMRLDVHLIMGKGEEAAGGRQRSRNLAGVFEAVVGALIVDQGYEAARQFVLRAVAHELEETDEIGALKSPKSVLQELLQSRGMTSPTYRLVEETGRDHLRQFTSEVLIEGKVMGRGKGKRKVLAEQEAAREALKALGYKG